MDPRDIAEKASEELPGEVTEDSMASTRVGWDVRRKEDLEERPSDRV